MIKLHVILLNTADILVRKTEVIYQKLYEHTTVSDSCHYCVSTLHNVCVKMSYYLYAVIFR